MFSRPATIRNALPYSNDCAMTRPAPEPGDFRDEVRHAHADVGERRERHERL